MCDIVPKMTRERCNLVAPSYMRGFERRIYYLSEVFLLTIHKSKRYNGNDESFDSIYYLEYYQIDMKLFYYTNINLSKSLVPSP